MIKTVLTCRFQIISTQLDGLSAILV